MATIYSRGHTPGPLRTWGIAASAETSPQKFVAYSGEGYGLTHEEAQTVAKRANAYQKLVGMLRGTLQMYAAGEKQAAAAKALLRELGEEA